MPKPIPGTYPAYMEKYVMLVEADSVRETINKYAQSLMVFFENIPEEKAGYRYAEGKWSVKEMLQHIIDTERIFGYRALSIARKDTTPLPGFDENTYANASKADERSLAGLIEELKAVRTSTDLLLKSFTEDDLQQTGITNGHPNTVNAIGFIIFGHILHHKKILEERYF
ncbi:MAG: DinB family protein [Segetibacter sp.]